MSSQDTCINDYLSDLSTIILLVNHKHAAVHSSQRGRTFTNYPFRQNAKNTVLPPIAAKNVHLKRLSSNLSAVPNHPCYLPCNIKWYPSFEYPAKFHSRNFLSNLQRQHFRISPFIRSRAARKKSSYLRRAFLLGRARVSVQKQTERKKFRRKMLLAFARLLSSSCACSNFRPLSLARARRAEQTSVAGESAKRSESMCTALLRLLSRSLRLLNAPAVDYYIEERLPVGGWLFIAVEDGR